MVEKIIVGMFRANCYIYSQNNKDCIIIDPGGDHDRIISTLRSLKLTPIGIALTHGHMDHTSAVGKLVDFYKAEDVDIKIGMNEQDKNYMGEKARAVNKSTIDSLGIEEYKNIFETFYVPLPEADIYYEEGDKVFNTDLVVINTPGHTRGSIAFYSASDEIIFSGDTLFLGGIGRADMPDGDGYALMDSIKTKLLRLPFETIVYPGHGHATTIEHETKMNPHLK